MKLFAKTLSTPWYTIAVLAMIVFGTITGKDIYNYVSYFDDLDLELHEPIKHMQQPAIGPVMAPHDRIPILDHVDFTTTFSLYVLLKTLRGVSMEQPVEVSQVTYRDYELQSSKPQNESTLVLAYIDRLIQLLSLGVAILGIQQGVKRKRRRKENQGDTPSEQTPV
jgi:hypothetical protein